MTANVPANPVAASSGNSPSPYAQEVFAWGRKDPWRDLPKLSHRDIFAWSDVQTDGLGNVLSMPLLRGKPCFGLPQVFIRHGKSTRMVTNAYCKRVESKTHRCGRCPIRESCSNLVGERLKSDRSISAALLTWHRYCAQQHNSVPTYSNTAGRKWQAFLQALADRGPFANSNDQKLADWNERDKKDRVEKWRRDKVRQRQRLRTKSKSEGMAPPAQFEDEAKCGRDDRYWDLLEVAGSSEMPPSISKIAAKDAETTAAVTADAWLGRLLISASGGDPNPGAVASWMIQQGRAHGKSYAVLKARLKRDLARADLLEALDVCPSWRPFDPDADLDLPHDELQELIDAGWFEDDDS